MKSKKERSEIMLVVDDDNHYIAENVNGLKKRYLAFLCLWPR